MVNQINNFNFNVQYLGMILKEKELRAIRKHYTNININYGSTIDTTPAESSGKIQRLGILPEGLRPFDKRIEYTAEEC